MILENNKVYLRYKLNNMKNTAREYENMANAILATFEWNKESINEFVKPAYFVTISESGKSAKFECYYTNEDDREDKRPAFTLLETDSMGKLISYVEDDYWALSEIEPNL